MPSRSFQAREFLYPVASFVNQKGRIKLYILYQKSLKHLELWQWDPQTKCATKALHSDLTPAGLRMLPNNVGFSFIDDGRLKVKKFNRRSPKIFDIRQPLYEIGIVNWIDEDRGYFSAKERGHYAIFQLDMRDDLERVVFDQDADCLYPNKVGTTLFYIERAHNKGSFFYSIVTIPYPDISYIEEFAFNSHECFTERVQGVLHEDMGFEKRTMHAAIEQKKLLYGTGEKSIAFLRMVNENEGFFIEHPSTVGTGDKLFLFPIIISKKRGIHGNLPIFFLFQFLFSF